ncbi:MAG: HDOD domain-containing protein [Steroidobacteraceae bacterium]
MTAAPNTEAAPSASMQRDASMDAFEFVRELATELSSSTIELPSFPDVALRVQKVLAADDASAERVVRVLGAEPVLATRVLSMANSAALNPGGKAVTDLRTAVTRLGFDALRAAAMSFAMGQLKRAKAFQGIERHLNVLWQHSVLVASLCYVVARRASKVSPDMAMLTGLVHGVGKLYILTHSMRHPALFGDQATYQRIVKDWHGNIAKALLESWSMAEEIVAAVHSYEDSARELRGTSAALADVLEIADMLTTCKDSADLIRTRLANRKAAIHLGLDAEICLTLVAESAAELAALRTALGH